MVPALGRPGGLATFLIAMPICPTGAMEGSKREGREFEGPGCHGRESMVTGARGEGRRQ